MSKATGVRIASAISNIVETDAAMEAITGQLVDRVCQPVDLVIFFATPHHGEHFDTIGQHGSRLGTGLLTVVSERQSIVSLLRNLEQFFARQSCGWCTPCRDGLPWTVKLLQALERGEGEQGDIEILEQHTTDLGPGLTFCAHAPGAAMPLESALNHFRADFEAGIAHPRRTAHADSIPVGEV